MKCCVVIVAAMLSLAGCAGQRLPEGGPVDTVPPEILSVLPAPNAVNVTTRSVVIEFSEYVDRRSTEEAIFISPAVEQKEFDWSGTELEIHFLEDLRKNTTYVISIGTDVMDIRARNRMSRSFTLAFSTGDSIDTGAIGGRVFDEKPGNVMIFAYRLDGTSPDTLNPATTKPEYITQSGKTGEFLLTNLRFGTYRVFAVRDEYRNLLYDPEIDAAGATDDVTLTRTDSVRTGLSFTLSLEDTSAPRISSVTATDRNHLLVKFSERLDPRSVAKENIAVTDTLFSLSVPITNMYPASRLHDSYTVVTGDLRNDSIYLFSARGMIDRSGHRMRTQGGMKLFTGSGLRDTIPPSLIFSTLAERSGKIFFDDTLFLSFNDDIASRRLDSAVTLIRMKDTSIVTLSVRKVSPVELAVIPLDRLNQNELYRMEIRWNFVQDGRGNAYRDSVSYFSLLVDDPDNYGSIEGSFGGYPVSQTVLEARNIQDSKQPVAVRRPDSAGKFAFTRLPEGRYAVKAIDDRNGNNMLDAGKPFPHQRGERFTMYSDTIRVRARWPVDGVQFISP